MKYNDDVSLTANLINLLGCGNRSNIFNSVLNLSEQRDELFTFGRDLRNRLKLPGYRVDGDVFQAIDTLRTERDDALKLRESYNSNVEDWRELCGYFNLPVSELSAVMKAIDTMRLERDMLRAERKVLSDLNEIRYVLHGDIQPCTVLYSDDTTTLLRLDEGDIMCETDTIEWSDSVTYRCQELLRGEAKRCGIPITLQPVNLLAQLVRDERILLNDDALEAETGSDARHSPTASAREWTANNSPTPLR